MMIEKTGNILESREIIRDIGRYHIYYRIHLCPNTESGDFEPN